MAIGSEYLYLKLCRHVMWGIVYIFEYILQWSMCLCLPVDHVYVCLETSDELCMCALWWTVCLCFPVDRVCVLKRVIDCVCVPCSARPCNVLADGAEGAGAGTVSGGPAGLLPHLHWSPGRSPPAAAEGSARGGAARHCHGGPAECSLLLPFPSLRRLFLLLLHLHPGASPPPPPPAPCGAPAPPPSGAAAQPPLPRSLLPQRSALTESAQLQQSQQRRRLQQQQGWGWWQRRLRWGHGRGSRPWGWWRGSLGDHAAGSDVPRVTVPPHQDEPHLCVPNQLLQPSGGRPASLFARFSCFFLSECGGGGFGGGGGGGGGG